MENTNGSMSKNNKMIWVLAGILVIVAVLIFAFKDKGTQMSDDTLTNGEAVTEAEATEDVSEGSVNQSVGTSSGAVSLSYQKALETYGDRRIQLSDVQPCVATPNTMTFKNGTNIMIDNRSSQTRTIKLGSTFSIKGYGFKIVKLSSSTVPTTWLMDCGASQNVATILIQK